MSVSIRPAEIADAAEIARLSGQLGYEVDTGVLGARLARTLERSDQRFFIAEAGGRPVGWLHAARWEFIEAGDFVVIAGIVVDRGHRKRGIGRRLMEEAERWARDQGCPTVRLWSSAARVEAHRFYAGLGYANLKTQYAFAKSLAGEDLKRFVPKVEGTAP